MNTDLFSSFPQTPAEIWRTRIEKDLKGKSIESMQWSPDDELLFSPYIHADDIPDVMRPLPRFGQWSIGEHFDVIDVHATNEQILESLTGGVESIHLTIGGNVEWATLLNKVELPLIHLGIRFAGDTNEGLNAFIEFASSQAVFRDLDVTVDGRSVSNHEFRFCTGVSWEKGIVNSMVDTLCSALDDSDWNSTNLSNRDLRLSIGQLYLIEIARIRACRILWENLAEALQFDLTPDFAIEVHTAPDHGDDPYTHMIRAAFMGTAAVLGGADRVFIQHANGDHDSSAFHRHVARNIQHLLRYESKFTEIRDPVPGAFYIENVTQLIVEKSWTQLLMRIKEGGHRRH